MHRFETIGLGTYRGHEYVLTGFVEPAPGPDEPFDPDTDADQYGVVLTRSLPYVANVEIVRMDIAHGQDPHMDLVYLPPNLRNDRRVVLDDRYSYDRMKRYLLTHWRDFVDGYRYYNE